MKDRTKLSLALLPIYVFLSSCLPRKDLELFDNMVQNRLALNYGTSEFCITQMDKHYRPIAKKYLEIIDECMKKAGEV